MGRRLPIGIQSFQSLVETGCVYVDKTEYCFRLITQGKHYFLSRPRRFGKSLLVSTFKAIFEGKRELFAGLWIEDKVSWEPRPVILLDFSLIFEPSIPLDEALSQEMDRLTDAHGVSRVEGGHCQKLRHLLRQLSEIQKVVVLVDEYDKPINHHIEDLGKARSNALILQDFYTMLGACDKYTAFCFVTGISPVGKAEMFADWAHVDLTLDESFSTMVGFTKEEIWTAFPEELDTVAISTGATPIELICKIDAWYNGYSWDGSKNVFNPWAILLFLSKSYFGYYWFATGTPTFLMKLIKQAQYGIFDFENRTVSLRAFNTFDLADIDINSLLFQTGYLTIKKLDADRQTVTLDFPNREVANAFSFHLLAEFAEKRQAKTDSLLLQMNDHLQQGHVAGFIEAIITLFADIANPIQPSKGAHIANMEKYYHTMFYLTLRLLGYNIQSEVFTNIGRIDAVITTDNHIYVFEFKLGDAASAMAQIKAKGYHQKYLRSGKKVVLLGIGFDVVSRNVGEFLMEEVE